MLNAVTDVVRHAPNGDYRRAIGVLRTLGPSAKSLMPDLIRRCEGSRSRHSIAWALTIAVIDPNSTNKSAARVRRVLAGDPEESGDLDEVLYELESAGPWAKSLVKELISNLKSNQSNRQLIRILEDIGPDAADALPLLRSLRDRSSGDFQQRAMRAIRAIEGQ